MDAKMHPITSYRILSHPITSSPPRTRANSPLARAQVAVRPWPLPYEAGTSEQKSIVSAEPRACLSPCPWSVSHHCPRPPSAGYVSCWIMGRHWTSPWRRRNVNFLFGGSSQWDSLRQRFDDLCDVRFHDDNEPDTNKKTQPVQSFESAVENGSLATHISIQMSLVHLTSVCSIRIKAAIMKHWAWDVIFTVCQWIPLMVFAFSWNHKYSKRRSISSRNTFHCHVQAER